MSRTMWRQACTTTSWSEVCSAVLSSLVQDPECSRAFRGGADKGGDKGIVYTWGRNTKGQLGIGSLSSQLSPVKVKWTTCAQPNSWVCSPNLCKDRICERDKCRSFGPTNPYWTEADMHCMKPQDQVWVGEHPEVVQVAAAEDSSYALTGLAPLCSRFLVPAAF